MQTRLMARVVLSGELDPDPDAAAAALREAGYEVVKPEKFPFGDSRPDFMEVTKRVVGNEVKQVIEMVHDVNTIVLPYEGICDACGQIDENHVPFSEPWAGCEVEQGEHEQERSDE
jgi:hypothetical protein